MSPEFASGDYASSGVLQSSSSSVQMRSQSHVTAASQAVPALEITAGKWLSSRAILSRMPHALDRLGCHSSQGSISRHVCRPSSSSSNEELERGRIHVRKGSVPLPPSPPALPFPPSPLPPTPSPPSLSPPTPPSPVLAISPPSPVPPFPSPPPFSPSPPLQPPSPPSPPRPPPAPPPRPNPPQTSPSPPPHPPPPAGISLQFGYAAQFNYIIAYQQPTSTQLYSLRSQVAQSFSVPIAQVQAGPWGVGGSVDALYRLASTATNSGTSAGGSTTTCPQCTATTQSQMQAALCNSLVISSSTSTCTSLVNVLCITPANALTSLPQGFPPPTSLQTLIFENCTTYVLAAFTLTPATDTAVFTVSLLATSVNLQGYVVQGPQSTADLAVAAYLQVNVSNNVVLEAQTPVSPPSPSPIPSPPPLPPPSPEPPTPNPPSPSPLSPSPPLPPTPPDPSPPPAHPPSPSPPSPPLPSPSPPSPPPPPPAHVYTLYPGQQLASKVWVPGNTTSLQTTNVQAAVAVSTGQLASAISVAVNNQYVATVYTITSSQAGVIICSSILSAFTQQLYTQLYPIVDPGYINTECVTGNGYPSQMNVVQFIPLQAVNTAGVQIAAQILLTTATNTVQTAIQLLPVSILFGGYNASTPSPPPALISSQLEINISYPVASNPSGRRLSSSARRNLVQQQPPPPAGVAISDQGILAGVDSGLSLSAPDLAISLDQSGWSIGNVYPGPSPPPPACNNPVLGNLCGSNAVGAIIGLAVGGAAVLALVSVAVVYGMRGKSASIVAVDDPTWAARYAHIMPSNVVASPYATQYAPGK
ncbi:hypothetical protein CEUSTIGMA_g9035.t1 [Chlamydomonas eustigma]|uniref:Uncharacterized protein n=1 Tax=Chlamydomonas eustigma TaxID=1157962 RepID=A0A250XEV9_9CHLO|nr:hypothetical protein CEUSTIGMA_g9035.t1 [Chlamydomonas eustigma]|eukprot:GAX81607.1 hypothetical protein CEUSTIGMA_g9035.t1 [Chlamydomonas eustigma]